MTHLGCKLHGSYDELVEYFIISGIDWKVKVINILNATKILFIYIYVRFTIYLMHVIILN